MVFDYESVIGLITIIIGVSSMIITYIARKRLSNPLLLKYLTCVLLSIVFLTFFSTWHTIRETLELKAIYGAIIEIPEYIFVIATYVLFLIGARVVLNMSKQFGFKDVGKTIKKELKKKTKK